MKKAEILLEKSIKSQLCSYCGVCAGMCPVHAINIGKNDIIIDVDRCIDCGLCVNCCPAGGYELTDVTLEDIKDIPKFSVAAKNKDVSEHASSGGFVTQALLTLLANEEITAAAVVVAGDDLDSRNAKYVITDDPNVILQARRSKYTQAAINEVIEYIKAHEGKYAIVGVPCQLYGITQATKTSVILRNRIKYKFGMVCGYTYDEDCIDGLLKVMKLQRQDVNNIVGWREGGLPGCFSVELKNGEVRSLPFADEHSVDVTFYAQQRCKLCRDCLCEYGDVVSADIGGWREKRTLVLVRSWIGHQLLSILENSDDFLIDECDVPFEKTVIPFMLREKRAKVDIRLSKYDGIKPGWVGGYSPKLLLSQKIENSLSCRLEEKNSPNKKSLSAEKMLDIGHKAYHKMSSLLLLKILYKLQIYSVNALHAFQNKAELIHFKVKLSIRSLLKRKTKNALRVGIIGLGRWGAQYLSFLTESKYFNLVAAYDTNSERISELSKKYHFIQANNLDDLFLNNNLEAVFVLTPTQTHYTVYNSIAKYNIPIYMEKPISSDVLSATDIVNDGKSRNALLYVAHSMKYEDSMQRIKALLDEGMLGNIESFTITRSVKYRKSDYDNAALYQIGVHIIDLILYFFGNAKSIDAYEHYESSNHNVDYVNLTMQNEIQGEIRYGFTGTYNFNICIHGSKAILIYADSKLTIYKDQKKDVQILTMKNEKTVFDELEEFFFALRENKSYLNTADNALGIMRICDAIIKKGCQYEK